MKRVVVCAVALAAALPALAQAGEADMAAAIEAVGGAEDDGPAYTYPRREKVYPAPKRPRKPTAEQVRDAEDKNEEHATKEYVEKTAETFRYGRTDEISELLDSLTADEDARFMDAVYDTFQETRSDVVRRKALAYFTKLKDPCLEDYAVEVINDPFDVKKDVVSACFAYVAAVGCKDAVPGVVELVDGEEADYFNAALSCLGEIGGPEEAQFVAQYIGRDDLTTSQKQALVRVLGKIRAVETWDKLVEIAQDEDQNTFVRAYAAEAIGAMEKKDAIPILAELYESEEPVIREHAVKGLAHFDDKDSSAAIIQALRDDNYKVRMEALAAIEAHGLTDADKAIIYHCKNKEEQVVKNKCYTVLARLNTRDGNDYLVSVLSDAKASEATKARVAAALLEADKAGASEVIALAQSTLKDDRQKSLRYALGKEFAKYGRPAFAQVCADYIASKDAATQGTGLDIFARGKYSAVRGAVEALARQALEAEGEEGKKARKTASANAKKARRIYENLYGPLKGGGTVETIGG